MSKATSPRDKDRKPKVPGQQPAAPKPQQQPDETILDEDEEPEGEEDEGEPGGTRPPTPPIRP